jgi:predicted CXXCH cytochrome family protein
VRHALLISLLFLPLAAAAQLKMDRSKECVICHDSWGDGYEKLEALLPPNEHPVMIDGRRARVAAEEMCWSCHDGYVGDSRRYFAEGDPHLRRSSGAADGLPRDLNGQIYCGTCHTPHLNRMEREFSYTPFLRAGTERSELCLKCHADHARRRTDHPIHARLQAALPDSLAGKRVSTTTVECLTCHRMHDARSVKLAVEKDRTGLCRSCHEESFAVLQSDHDLAAEHSGLAIGETKKVVGRTDACEVCHLTHGGKGPAMWAWPLPGVRNGEVVQGGVDARCLGCHNEQGAAAGKSWRGHGHPLDPEVREQGVQLPLVAGRQMSCTTCHDPHRWSALPGRVPGAGNEEGDALGSFLRLPDDENGRLCVNCHNPEAQTLVSDHNSFNWSEPSRGQCSSCHSTHGASRFADGHAVPGVSEFTSLCLSCHSGEGKHGATTLGRHGHPLGVPLMAAAGLPGYRADTLEPWRPAMGDPGEGVIQVGCESCHEPHHWSPVEHSWNGPDARGDDASSFLRLDNRGALLCVACHERERQVLASPHDLNAEHPRESACRSCHTTHRAVSDWAIIASSLPDSAMAQVAAAQPEGSLERNPDNWSPGARHCLSCHREGGASKVLPQAWGHPQKYTTVDGPWRPDGRSMPLFDAQGRALGPTGRIDCTSCHNPHVARPATAGEHAPDFLRQETSEAVCSDCHGDKALWKYRYFHLADKRVLP